MTKLTATLYLLAFIFTAAMLAQAILGNASATNALTAAACVCAAVAAGLDTWERKAR